jgi:putative secretion ATPase (PEP-CTERM system associated)
MYEDYYHFRARPFQLSPDPRFFFYSRGHRRAMAYLQYGVHQGEGFLVITGEIGAGKTMLARTLAQKFGSPNLLVAQVVSTMLEADDMLHTVAAAFDLPEEKSKAQLLKKIEKFLLARSMQGKRTILIVDEVQNLSKGALEELRMLSNFQHKEKSLLQSFLLGQPEFRGTLHSPDLEQLRQRVTASYHLGPIDAAETEAYIEHRLKTAGWTGDPAFSQDAFPVIHRFSGGIPRKINHLCDRLLLLGRMDEKHTFTVKDVFEVIDDLKNEFGPMAGQFSAEDDV